MKSLFIKIERSIFDKLAFIILKLNRISRTSMNFCRCKYYLLFVTFKFLIANKFL